MRTIFITGVSGFVGGGLARHFLSAGYKVTGLGRKPVALAHENFSGMNYRLEEEPDPALLKDADCIIHCAFARWSEDCPDADEINIKATMWLADLCKRENKKFVFLSSFSAHAQATSHYGRHKFQLESRLKSDHLVIKPGLVLGAGGMLAGLKKIIAERKFIPVIGDGKQHVQWLRLEELCKAIEHGINLNLTGIFPVASIRSITFLELNELIAALQNRSPFFIFIHPLVAKFLIGLAGKKVPFTKENLEGLLQLKEIDTKDSLERLVISIGDIRESLSKEI